MFYFSFFELRGYIIPIGGAEGKTTKPVILARVTDLTMGNSRGYLVVIPTASQLEETGPNYLKIFTELGVEHVVTFSPETRADCEKKDCLLNLEKATMIFITGGTHVAGTSAGAAILTEHMIAGGAGGPTPTRSGVEMAAGLVLTNSLIIDQHFRQRDRLGRLLSVIFYSPFMIGMGIDEDTAVFINPDDELKVVGSGTVTIIDPSDLQYSSTDSVKPHGPVSLIGLGVHLLANGAHYNINTREAIFA